MERVTRVGVWIWEKWLFRLIENVKVSRQTVALGRLTDWENMARESKKQNHNRGCVCTPVGLSVISHASADWLQFKSDLRRAKQGHSSTSQTLAFLLKAWMFICSNQSLKEQKSSNWQQWKNKWLTSQQPNACESGLSWCQAFVFLPSTTKRSAPPGLFSAVFSFIRPSFQWAFSQTQQDTKEKYPRTPLIYNQLLKVKL